MSNSPEARELTRRCADAHDPRAAAAEEFRRAEALVELDRAKSLPDPVRIPVEGH